MRLWVGMLCVVVLAVAAAATASSAPAAPTSQSTSAKICSSKFVQADFPWGRRCIRAGQFCKKVRNPEYHKYNYQCVNGKLRKQNVPKKKEK